MRLIRTELWQILQDASLRWIGAVLVALLSVAVAGAWQQARREAADVRAITEAERGRWLGQDAKNPHSADHYGLWVFKPSSPLAILDPGTEPFTGRMIRVEAHLFNDAVFRAVQDASPLARAGLGSVADIVQLIVPLAAIMLGFSAFAADRERGTLRLALGNGAPPGRLFAGRLVALLLATGLVVGVPLLGLGGLAAASLDAPGWAIWTRLVLWVAAQVVYACAFLVLAMTFSLAARTARAALAASLLAWVILCVAAPRLATIGVETFAPAISYRDTRARIDGAFRAHRTAEANDARAQAVLARYGVSDPEDLPVDLRGLMMSENERHNFAVFDAAFGAFFDSLLRQERGYAWAGLLSPRIALQALSTALAGTDFSQHVHFVWGAERYRRSISERMNQAMIDNPQGGGRLYMAGHDLWEEVPPFRHDPVPLGGSLREAALPAAMLAFWLAALGGIATLAVGRVKP
jgi:ABC-2 type transport system permease protein